MASVLYITYDGLTDPIGQSQILPYLLGSAEAGHRLTVISFEKPQRLALAGDQVRAQFAEHGIAWLPQQFRSSPPYLAKAIDMVAMRRAAAGAVRNHKFDLIHARSYQAAVTGLALKRKAGAKLLFDMRGFWPDQRREGGRWRSRSLLGSQLYRRWKAHEARLIAGSDHIVALTQAARQEMLTWPSYRGAPISVIPCCADFDLFALPSAEARRVVRQRLELQDDTPILGYLGSIGTVYRLAPHFALLRRLRDSSGAKGLFVCRESESEILDEARKLGTPLSPDDIRVVRAERAEVPSWLGAVDVATCFITPTFSSLGVSPTKLGEYWACGVPVYANAGIGDVAQLIGEVDGGQLLPDLGDASVDLAAAQFATLAARDPTALRDRARARLDLGRAIDAYARIYDDWQQPVSLVAA